MNRIIFIIGVALVFATSCNKELDDTSYNFPALQPTSIDLNAGLWKPILITGPTEFTVPAPAATNTPDYVAQINEIKSYQSSLSTAEKNAVSYWGAGAVLRWSEIMRELVAKHKIGRAHV